MLILILLLFLLWAILAVLLALAVWGLLATLLFMGAGKGFLHRELRARKCQRLPFVGGPGLSATIRGRW